MALYDIMSLLCVCAFYNLFMCVVCVVLVWLYLVFVICVRDFSVRTVFYDGMICWYWLYYLCGSTLFTHACRFDMFWLYA